MHAAESLEKKKIQNAIDISDISGGEQVIYTFWYV